MASKTTTTTKFILCLSDEVLYNMMNEKIIAGLSCRLESLYMTKSLLNKLFHEEAVIQPSDEGRYAYFIISQCF